MNIIKALCVTLAMATPMASASPPAKCPEQIATELLTAITSQNVAAINAIANNLDVFDSKTMQYLIGDANFRIPKRTDLRSAYVVLANKKVLKKVVSSELVNGVTTIDVIYLPADTTESFSELSDLVKQRRASPFKNYVMCNIVIKNGISSMPHACYAETDALD